MAHGFAIRGEPTVRDVEEVPAGYRGLGRCLNETRKSYLFEYFGHELWIPKSAVVRSEGSYWAPGWAITSAKEYNDGKRR